MYGFHHFSEVPILEGSSKVKVASTKLGIDFLHLEGWCEPGHLFWANVLHEVNVFVFWRFLSVPKPAVSDLFGCLYRWKDVIYLMLRCSFRVHSIAKKINYVSKQTAHLFDFFFSDLWGIDSQFDLHILVKLGPSSYDVWIILSISFSFIFQCLP